MTRQRLHEHLARRLDGLEVVALFMDGVVVAQQTVIVVLGIGLLHVNRLKNGMPSTHPLRVPELRALRRLRRGTREAPTFSRPSTADPDRLRGEEEWRPRARRRSSVSLSIPTRSFTPAASSWRSARTPEAENWGCREGTEALLLENAVSLHGVQPPIVHRPKPGMPLTCAREHLPDWALGARCGKVILRERLDQCVLTG